MKKWKLFATLMISAAFLAPGLADAADLTAHPRYHRYAHHHRYGLPYSISYLHNYGPGFVPGTFAYYDGPSTNFCYQSSAAYLGQDHRRHPCF